MYLYFDSSLMDSPCEGSWFLAIRISGGWESSPNTWGVLVTVWVERGRCAVNGLLRMLSVWLMEECTGERLLTGV